MKNFWGRLIVLVCGVANVVIFLVIIGTFVFYCFSAFPSVAAFFTGELAFNYYIAIAFIGIDLIFFFYLTIHCLICITKGKPMKKTIAPSVIMFLTVLASLIYNVVTIHDDNTYFGFLYGIEFSLLITTAGFFIGSVMNYHKDCK